MENKIIIAVFALLLFNYGHAQNAACDGSRFKQPTFTTVKKTTLVYATAFTYTELPPSLPDTVDLKMDVYEPQGDNAVARPVVILAHGGSFITGDKNDMKTDCERFAKAGYVAVSIQYRLYPFLMLGFPDSTDIIGAVAKAIGDMKAAVRYFRQDAATVNLFKADTAHIFVGGYSAGAVTALHVGYVDETDDFTPFVQTAFDINGGINGNTGSAANQSYSTEVKGVYNRSGGLYRRTWIDEGEVPMVSIHGTADNTVYYISGLAAGIAYLEGTGILHPYALDQNVDSYLEIVTGGDHTSMYTSAQHAGQVNNFFNKALGKFEAITCGTSNVTELTNTADELLKITPNPVTNAFSITLDAPLLTAASVHIFDVQGKQVQTVLNYSKGQQIMVDHLPSGTYTVLLQNRVGVFKSGRFVKQ